MLAVAALAAGLAVLAWTALHSVVTPPGSGASPASDGSAHTGATTSAGCAADPVTEHAAHRMFVRNVDDDADPAMIELAWTDPAIRAFWLAEVHAVADDLRNRPW